MAAGDILEFVVQPLPEMTNIPQTVVLDGARYEFTFYTNKGDDGWYMDIANAEGVAQVQGIRLITGLDLLYRFRYLEVPPGVLFVNDLYGPREDPSLDTWQNQEAALYYQTTT